MRFSVIYEFEVPMRESVRYLTPPCYRTMQLTERRDGEPSDWDSELWDGKVRHRKWCGVLSKKQFDALIEQTGMWAENVETMGSIGAPGLFPDVWVAPAVSFTNDDPDSIQSMYVTPMPEVEPKRPVTPERGERVWRRVRQAMLSVYGNGR